MATTPEELVAQRIYERQRNLSGLGSTADTFVEVGYTGLKQSHGVILEEFLPQLRGIKAAQTYREMRDNDPLVNAMLFAIEMLLRRIEWTVDGDEPWAVEFVESLIDDMSHSWSEFIGDALSMLTYGWAFHEIVYKRRLNPDTADTEDPNTSKYPDGKIGWAKFPIRGQETLQKWELNTHGDVRGMWQYLMYGASDVTGGYNVFIPAEKALLFRAARYKNNPEGRSVLRGAYRAWWYKKRIEEFEAIGIERDLAGIPVVHLPPEMLDPNAPAEVQAARGKFEEMAKNVRNDEQAYIILPLAYNENSQPLFKFELMSSPGQKQFETSVVIARWGQQITMSTLTDLLLLGHEKVGSFALASSKSELLTAALQAWMLEIAEVINEGALPRLWRLNGFDIQNIPRIRPARVERVDMTEFSNAILHLSQAGMELFPDPALDQYVREQFSLPARSPEAQELYEEHFGQELDAAQQEVEPVPESPPYQPNAPVTAGTNGNGSSAAAG